MPEFAADTPRFDPYKSYKFRVKWEGRYVAGVSKMSGLTYATRTVTLREGGDASAVRRMPGQSAYEAITLEQGVTHDADFEAWANKIWEYSNTGHADDFRKDIVIELCNEAGQIVLAYIVHRCWPSEFTAVPELDGMGNAVAIQSLVLQNEGWERDESVPEPKTL